MEPKKGINSWTIPFYTRPTPEQLLFVTNKDILSIIKSLDSSKSHGHVSTCTEPVTISLKIIFEESIKKIIFPEIWKKKLISFV